MKTHLMKASLALVSAVFILGCQDVGTGPDGLVPQFHTPHGSCTGHNKDGPCDEPAPEGSNVGVTLAGGIMSAGQQLVTHASDGAVLNVFTGGRGFEATLNLTLPNFDISMCRTENDADDLAGYLTKMLDDDEQDGVSFNFQVDRKRSESRKHAIQVAWVQPNGAEDAGKTIWVQLRHDRDLGTVTVTESTVNDNEVFRFSGGTIRVLRSRGTTLSDRDRLICPYDGDDVVITLDRSP